ncbi:MAG: HAD-IA family hydrolase [Gemmatimonadaceae bacterium]
MHLAAMFATFSCDAVLFDLDGVLVDSAEVVERTWQRWAARHGLDPQDVIRTAHGRRTIETVRLLAPHLAADDEVAALAASESTETDGVYEVPGARELLDSLPAGSWAVVTSGIRPVAELRLRHTRLPTPPVLVTADQVRHGKPHPEGYLTAAARLGADPARCIVVEDTPPGIEAAHAGGMRVVAVASTYPAEALRPADAVVPTLAWVRSERSSGETLRITLREPLTTSLRPGRWPGLRSAGDA